MTDLNCTGLWAYVCLRTALFLKRGLRPYLRPFRPTWLGRAFSLVAGMPPGLWSPPLSARGCQLRPRLPPPCFLLFGRAACPGASPGSSPTLLLSHPAEGGTACRGALCCPRFPRGPGSGFSAALRCPGHPG